MFGRATASRVRPQPVLLLHHPARQPVQAETAAEGGADRRSAQGAAAPMDQSREALLAAGALHTPRGHETHDARVPAATPGSRGLQAPSACADRRWKRDCRSRGFTWAVAGALDRFRSAAPRRTALLGRCRVASRAAQWRPSGVRRPRRWRRPRRARDAGAAPSGACPRCARQLPVQLAAGSGSARPASDTPASIPDLLAHPVATQAASHPSIAYPSPMPESAIQPAKVSDPGKAI
jgi:hypothetical protein